MKRPNILYMMSDDHAANAISCYESILSKVFQTPNIDRIGREGCRMDSYCATNALCTPARASVMSGQYGHINGVRTLVDEFDLRNQVDVSKILSEHGYQTSMIGKWHLGCLPEGFDDYDILDGGYGEFGTHNGQQGIYTNPYFIKKGEETKQYIGYVSDIITEKAVEFLDKHDTTKPFFLMCNHKAPHDFWEYPKRHEHLFDGIDIPVVDSLFENREHRNIASKDYGSSVTPRSKVRNLYEDFCQDDYVTGSLVGTENMTFEEKGYAAYQKYLKDYLRTVKGIDDSVGEILKKLEDIGELDNTIIIYTSDQGMFLGEHDYQDKRWSFEESLRTPMLIRYPVEIPAGTICKELMANIDIAPTFLDYAGISNDRRMQGISCRNMIAGKEQNQLHEGIYFRYWMHRAHYHDNPAHYGIRTKEYKLTFYYGLPLDASGNLGEPTPSGYELYDLAKDPRELCNVYDEPSYELIKKELLKKLDDLKIQYGDTDDKYPELYDLRRNNY